MATSRESAFHTAGELVKHYIDQVQMPPKRNYISMMKPEDLKRARMAYHIPENEAFLYTYQANYLDSLHLAPEQRFYFTEKGFYGKAVGFPAASTFIPWSEFMTMEISEPGITTSIWGNSLRFNKKSVSAMWNGVTSRQGTRAWLDFYHGLQNYLKANADRFHVSDHAGQPAAAGPCQTTGRPVCSAACEAGSQDDGQAFDEPKVVRGHLSIPAGTVAIREREFDGSKSIYANGKLVRKADGNKHIFSVTIPGSVKSIGIRAFADCENLREIILSEGIERIESNAFTGCKKLRCVKLPSSLKEISGWAFFDSGITEPVFDASGERLIYCPEEAAKERYVVPEGVKEIGVQAFINMPGLKEVVLPEGLEVIKNRAFIKCGMREIWLPASVKLVEDGAFSDCGPLERILRAGGCEPFIELVDFWRMNGMDLLEAAKFALPEEEYWKIPAFKNLAQSCGDGNADAMNAMAEYFFGKCDGGADDKFYSCAGHFWKYRAWKYGSPAADDFWRQWARQTGNKTMVRVTSPFLNGRLEGTAVGKCLNALGFLFFDEDREYCVSGLDEDGVVLASAYESEDGPDEDGFGREVYEDWWYLDDCLNLPPGIKCLHSFSGIDRRMASVQKQFQDCHDQVARIIRYSLKGSCEL